MNEKLGSLIRFYRKEKGMTQAELGLAIGHSGKTSISKIELGINDANTETVIKIARALGVSPAVFLDCTEESQEDFSEFEEYIPYLAKASESDLRTIRYILKMPEKNFSKNGSYSEKIS